MFCPYCGKELIEGEEHTCPGKEAAEAAKVDETLVEVEDVVEVSEPEDNLFDDVKAESVPTQPVNATNVNNGAPANPTPAAPAGDKMEGFGKALASTIMGNVSYILLIIAAGMLAGGLAEDVLFVFATFFALGGIALAIVALIFGINSIKLFVRMKNEGKAKPIATLILGIVGVCSTAISFIYIFVFLTAFVAALAYI